MIGFNIKNRPMTKLSIDYRLHSNSGIGRYLRTIISKITKDDFDEIDLFFNLKNGLDHESIKEGSFNEVNTNSSIYSLREQLELPKVISPNTDLLWVPHYNIPVLFKGKMLVTIHDVAHLALPELFRGLHKKIYAKALFFAIEHRADHIICVSEFTKQELIKYTGVSSNKISVIHNGIEDSWYQVKKEKNPESVPYLLYVGNVKPHKNLKTFVQAFLKIKDKIPHNLVLVGKKEGFITGDNEISELVNRSPARIKFTGFIADSILKQYYLHADLFVFPSIYEGFGYPPLEAMACGTPVLASNAASIPEVCGEAAEYFSPYNVEELASKIVNILNKEEYRERLKKKGIKQSMKFRADNTARKTLDLIKKEMSK